MTMDNFPNGITSRGIPVTGTGGGAGAYGGGNIPATNGNYWFVSSLKGSNGFPGTMDQPFGTLAYAAALPNVLPVDVIVVLPGHVETVSSAGGITLSDAGLRVVCLGNGDARPIFNFGTVAGASMLISANNVSIDNFVGRTTLATTLANPIDITGNGCTITNFDWEDATGYEAIHVIRATAVSGLTAALRHKGLITSAVSVSPIVLYGCSEVELFVDYYGLSSIAVVQFGTGSGASTGVRVSGQAYVSGIANGSRMVVDTVGGSTWFGSILDGVQGAPLTGSSAASFGVSGGVAERIVQTAAATMAQATDTLFTVSGGPIQVDSIAGICVTPNNTNASTLFLQANATAGGATAMSAASATLASAAAGTSLSLPAAAATATVLTTAGTVLSTQPNWIVPVGTIQAVVGTAAITGTWQWYLKYRPLSIYSNVTNAY